MRFRLLPDSVFFVVMMNTASAQRLNRSLGVRSEEARTVRLFFLHHFFLGLGTILVYVSANVILLENHPETSLPVAYVMAALGMMGVGKLYAYFEHRLPLSSLVFRVVWSVIILTVLIVGLVAIGHSVAMAVAIMVGYRAIYLLTNLEFWGISALVFDVRQGKRLFSVISSGDMPAKAMGAILAALVHNHTELIYLLLIAFVFFGSALITVWKTIQSHEVHAAHGPSRPVRRPQGKLVTQLFGGSELIFAMCLSVLSIASIAAGIEYAFFINVKYRFHDQALVMRSLGIVLASTYLLAMIVKLLASRRALDRFGILNTMRLLPVAALLWIAGYLIVAWQTPDETSLMIYYCGLYLVFEVVRRSLFDPVFLVLFQPLPPHQRLKGHTLAKGFYEPLGMGLAGGMIFLLRNGHENLNAVLLTGMAVVGIVTIGFIQRTYRQYLATLHDALGRRFIAADELPLTDDATKLVRQHLQSERPEEVLTAIDWLRINKPDVLAQQASALIRHPAAAIRLRVLTDYKSLALPDDELYALTQQDTDADVRREAAVVLCSRSKRPQDLALLESADVAVRQGAILGFLQANPTYGPARKSLDGWCADPDITHKQFALTCIRTLRLMDYVPFVEACLSANETLLTPAALDTAAELADIRLLPAQLNLLADKHVGRMAARSIAAMHGDVLSGLKAYYKLQTDPAIMIRVISVAERMRTSESHQWLITLMDSPLVAVRTAVLKAIKNFPHIERYNAVFYRALDNDVQLAQRLLNAVADVKDEALDNSLLYEQERLTQRMLLTLSQLYDKEIIENVRANLAHESSERQANSLEVLENLVPRPVYNCLQILVEDLPVSEKIRQFNEQVGVYQQDGSIQQFILEQGDNLFTDWTIACALRNLPTADQEQLLTVPFYFSHSNPVIREGALDALTRLARQKSAVFQALITQHPELTKAMSHDATAASTVSATERVFILKNNALFAGTPDNVLSSVVPIMKEVTFNEGEDIVRKGEPGTCMFIIYSGQVGIYDEHKELAVLERGNFFGELALLDTEPRSATAVAHTPVTLFRIDQDDIFDLMTEREEVLRNMIRVLCQRIRQQNIKLRSMPAEA
nr:cyclic nucleotide-binding domain-containing protein [uncultured Arsenicibacter sp.]